MSNPYLQQNNPDLDSAIQALMDEAAAGSLTEAWTTPVSVVLCGSAMSVMTRILSGTSPMRGRAALDMPLAAFDYRQARGHWGITDMSTAFAVDTVVGGGRGLQGPDRRRRNPRQHRRPACVAGGDGAEPVSCDVPRR